MASADVLQSPKTTSAPPDSIQQLPGFAVADTFRMLRHAMDDALRDLDLTTPQWGALACLGEKKGLTGAEMARMYHLTPQTMHTILQNLEAAGLVVRDPDPAHGTILRTHLTQLGQERLVEAMKRAHAVQDRLVSDLNEQERQTLIDLLQRCARSLQVDGASPLPLSEMCAD